MVPYLVVLELFFELPQALHYWDDERKGLSRPGARIDCYILVAAEQRDGRLLDRRGPLEAKAVDDLERLR